MRLILGCLLFALACDDGAEMPDPMLRLGDAGSLFDQGLSDMDGEQDAAADAGTGDADDAGTGDAGTDAAPPEGVLCRLTSQTHSEGGTVAVRTTYEYDSDGPRSSFTARTDTGDDGTVDVTIRVEYPDDERTIVRSDTDGDGEFEGGTQTRTTTSADGLVIDQETATVNGDTTRYRSEYLSADRGTPEGLFPHLQEVDGLADGTINRRMESMFEAGRIVRQQTDSSPARWNDGDDTGPDGVPESVTTYVYTANAVTEFTDVGRGACSGGVCEGVLPDGETDRITERTYGDRGRPEMVWAGAPEQQRDDFDADGTWDRVTAYAYAESGRLARVRYDSDADGVWESETTMTYDCEE